MYGFVLDHKVSSKSLGIRFCAPVEIPTATMGIEDIEVSGRAGTLTRLKGWQDGEITLKLAVRGGLEAFRKAAHALTGAHTIGFSGEPGMFRYLKHVKISPALGSLSTWVMFETELCCQPFTYLETGLKQLTLNASGTINNPGLLASDPVITVFGTGELELKINDTALIVSAPSGQLTIDSPRLTAHFAGKTQTDGISGVFPQLSPGTNHIKLGTGISRIEVKGNWRTL
ncbi:hypothetical protein R6G69_07260 [Actinotignum urinale]|uniref:hypothetical protein n=1 Tax=Actinotignum urinale TaxID=190146 RepID=UPI002A829BF3|nr:hypothetical protein [Actinotignum urinale]MDY5129776.1 hypothetical protein [Actinotignum urinale]